MSIQYVMLFIFFILPQQNTVRRENTPKLNFIERTFHSYYDYTLRWGNKQFTRSLPDTFTINGLNNPYFWHENYFSILLKVNTNHGHSVLRVLPLNESAPVRTFEDPIAFDEHTNQLACVLGPKQVKIIDLSNGKSSVVAIRLPGGSKDIISSLVMAILENNELKLNWINTPSKVFKTYKIRALK